jgi:hypothetical protein
VTGADAWLRSRGGDSGHTEDRRLGLGGDEVTGPRWRGGDRRSGPSSEPSRGESRPRSDRGVESRGRKEKHEIILETQSPSRILRKCRQQRVLRQPTNTRSQESSEKIEGFG